MLHLMRGQIYEISGKTFFTLDGARSHDMKDGILDPAEPDFQVKRPETRRQTQISGTAALLVSRRAAL